MKRLVKNASNELTIKQKCQMVKDKVQDILNVFYENKNAFLKIEYWEEDELEEDEVEGGQVTGKIDPQLYDSFDSAVNYIEIMFSKFQNLSIPGIEIHYDGPRTIYTDKPIEIIFYVN